jgi:uncharacterized membrane protein
VTAFNDFAIARAVHVFSVLIWIGGVAFVTLVLLPACRTMAAPRDQLELFERFEHRFAAIARWTVLLAGLSGLWLTWRLGVWDRFADPRGWWWMHGMVAVWTAFALMLYVLEPFVLQLVFARLAERDPVGLMTRIQRLHGVLLGVSLVVVLGAVAGSHGGWMF